MARDAEHDEVSRFFDYLGEALKTRVEDLDGGSVAQQIVLAVQCIADSVAWSLEMMEEDDKEEAE